jgi:hypothetical protein
MPLRWQLGSATRFAASSGPIALADAGFAVEDICSYGLVIVVGQASSEGDSAQMRHCRQSARAMARILSHNAQALALPRASRAFEQ